VCPWDMSSRQRLSHSAQCRHAGNARRVIEQLTQRHPPPLWSQSADVAADRSSRLIRPAFHREHGRQPQRTFCVDPIWLTASRVRPPTVARGCKARAARTDCVPPRRIRLKRPGSAGHSIVRMRQGSKTTRRNGSTGGRDWARVAAAGKNCLSEDQTGDSERRAQKVI